jgi:hypothetical protein
MEFQRSSTRLTGIPCVLLGLQAPLLALRLYELESDFAHLESSTASFPRL